MSATTLEQLAAHLAEGEIDLDTFVAASAAITRSTVPVAAVPQPKAAQPTKRAARRARSVKLTFGEARELDTEQLRAAWNADRITVRDMERLVALRKSRTGTPFRKGHIRNLQALEAEIWG